MATIGLLLIQILQILSWLLIIWVILSWLVAFNVINSSHPLPAKVLEVLDRIMMPVMEPIRKVVPSIGGIDISPLILIIGIQLLQQLVFSLMVAG